jgi:DNA replication and repair protein RecF
MHVTNLSLYNVRNYQRLDQTLNPGTTLLYGPNASGKTSFLEALFYLATTRSPRASTDRELIHWEAKGEAGALPFARMVAQVQRISSKISLEIIVQLRNDAQRPDAADARTRPQGASKKTVRINRKAARALDVIGQLRVVLFTPADMVLVSGSPSERRRYLDITLSQIDPHYVRTLSHYNRLVQQRNSLLRAWREHRRPVRAIDDELGYWDRELVAAGGYILAERHRAVAELNTIIGPLFRNIAGVDHPLQISYQSSLGADNLEHTTTDAGTQAQHMATRLHKLRRDELHRGQTLVGPHRDDLLFTVDAINLGVYGSRGQQRSVTLALKLAEARLMHKRSGEPPVLLLDDLLSELDMQRRTHLLQAIRQPEQQTILTATDLGAFDASFLESTTCLRVEQGHIYAMH